MNWSRAHWLVGLLTLLIFPLTGQYMRHVAAVPQLDDVPRLIFRSRHLFLLLAGVANIALSSSQPFHRAQRVASVLILVAPFLLFAAFSLIQQEGSTAAPFFASGGTASGSRACCWQSLTALAGNELRSDQC